MTVINNTYLLTKELERKREFPIAFYNLKTAAISCFQDINVMNVTNLHGLVTPVYRVNALHQEIKLGFVSG